MVTHSSILAWRIPWTEEPGRLLSIGLQSRTWLSDWACRHGCLFSYKLWLCWLLCMKVAQLCLTLCNTMDCSLPGFSVHGNSQTGILEWVAITFSSEASMEFNKVFLLHRGVSLPYRAPCFYFRAEKKMLESRSSESKPCSCVHRSYFLLKWSDFSISPKLHLRTCSGRHISLWKLAGLLRVPGQLGKWAH